MLIRHRNTHSDNSDSDTLKTPCTNEPQPVQFDSNDIYASFDLTSVSRTNESVCSGECENHPQQPVPVSPKNVEWSSLKQEPSLSELETSNTNPLEFLQHVNHLSTIENNLKQESDDLECEDDLHDPLLLQDLEVPSLVKYEFPGMSTESEHPKVLTTHEKSSNDMPAGSESFPGPSDLIRHKITQSTQKPHKCDICGKCFGKLHHLTEHKLTHTGEKPHKCDACGMCFTRNYHVIRHKLTHTGVRPYECDVCEKSFKQRGHLAQHRLTHTGEKSFHCDVCGKDFALKTNLRKHKLTHTGERPHKCDVCGRSFSTRTNLSIHKVTHTGEKPYQCDLCGRSFPKKAALIRHNMTHNGDKPHKCDECGKCFSLRSNLAIHKLTHTGEKLFHCDICGQNFYRGYELTKHKLKHVWQSTTTTLVNHLKEERESEEEGCQEDPLLNLEVSS